MIVTETQYCQLRKICSNRTVSGELTNVAATANDATIMTSEAGVAAAIVFSIALLVRLLAPIYCVINVIVTPSATFRSAGTQGAVDRRVGMVQPLRGVHLSGGRAAEALGRFSNGSSGTSPVFSSPSGVGGDGVVRVVAATTSSTF